MKSIENKIAENIVSRRKELGLTQIDLSHKAEIPQGMISEIERGKVNITISTLEKISSALKVEISDLVQELEIKDKTLRQKLEAIQQLSDEKKKVLETIINALLYEEQLQKLNKK